MPVYPVSEDTLLVKRNLENLDLKSKTVLEIGVGNAELSLSAVRMGAEVTAVDIDPEAVKHARKRIYEENFEADLFESDLFGNVSGSFDLVIFNPPYLSGPDIEASEAWRGGEKGTEVAEKFLERVSGYLEEGGKAWVVLSSSTPYKNLVERFELVEIDSENMWFETVFLYEF